MATLKEISRTATCRKCFPRYSKNFEGLSTSHRRQRQNGGNGDLNFNCRMISLNSITDPKSHSDPQKGEGDT